MSFVAHGPLDICFASFVHFRPSNRVLQQLYLHFLRTNSFSTLKRVDFPFLIT